MQMFGLISLVLVIALAAWWMSGMSTNSDGPAQERQTYQESIDAAEQAADYLSN